MGRGSHLVCDLGPLITGPAGIVALVMGEKTLTAGSGWRWKTPTEPWAGVISLSYHRGTLRSRKYYSCLPRTPERQ